MVRVGIIADDLTGAGDTAVQFVRAGWKTELQLRPVESVAEVIAVTTDSRGSSAREAAEAVAITVKRLRGSGVTHIYKKIDSTLRGQVRAEVQAALESWSPKSIAVVCPAFPAAARILIDGQLRVDGVPVAETVAGADPVTPITESHVPSLLRGSHLARRDGESAGQLAGRISENGPVVVVDAATEGDLRLLARAVALLGADAIAVGSAGLARHLAMVWAAYRPTPPAVVIVTSLHSIARRQAAAVAAAGAYHPQPGPEDLIDDEAWARWSANVLDGFGQAHSTLLLTSPADRRLDLPPSLIPRRLAELAARVIERGAVSGVVVTGGDGARALVDELKATGINLRDEVITSVPIGTLAGGPAHGLPVVTKAGGFGDDDTLLDAVETVRYRRYE
jgi:D-threonate/D-erythronate kinase